LVGLDSPIPTVDGSASLNSQAIYLTLTNSYAQEAAEVAADILGGERVNQAQGQVLAGEIHAYNTYNSPTLVTPRVLDVSFEPSQCNLFLQPAPVTAIQIQLG